LRQYFCLSIIWCRRFRGVVAKNANLTIANGDKISSCLKKLIMYNYFMANKNEKGFTLVEVLIVISIIGLLASIILVGLGGFRSKGRDTRRITDLRSSQTALELYYTKFNEYPVESSWDALETELRGAGVGVINIPRDPLTGRAGLEQYAYDVSSDRQSYVLRSKLEDPNTPQLRDDFDGFGSNPISGITIDCSDSATKPYYCVQF